MKENYNEGDKVVLRIDQSLADELNHKEPTDMNEHFINILLSSMINAELEEQKNKQEKKIKFTPEMKQEFDELHAKLFSNGSSNVYKAISTLVESNNYPALNAHVAGSFDKQMDLLNCLRNTSLIEVIEPEKHEVKIGTSYLCHYRFKTNHTYSIEPKIKTTASYQEQFNLTLADVKEAEKQLGIQGLQAKWHEASETQKRCSQ